LIELEQSLAILVRLSGASLVLSFHEHRLASALLEV
jgi:hypothetical protein